MRDSWVVLNGKNNEAAGWTFDTRNLRKRIDFVMVRGSEIQPQKLDLIGQMPDMQPDKVASDHLGVLVDMLVEVPTPVPTSYEPDDIHNTYFTTSWWATMLILGSVFIILDVVCCCIAWYS
jgi:hypothetical protein